MKFPYFADATERGYRGGESRWNMGPTTTVCSIVNSNPLA
jgi:hypothetical protein